MSTLLSAGQLPPNRHDDLDKYDLSDDPFASPSPPASSKKRKDAPSQDLGIDEEVSVQKRARPPAVKLDEDRLLGPAGLPKLRQRARDLKIKGKGHEFSDAARILTFYQMWLDDLFPKAKFLDALAMVEKAGHKKRVMAARSEMINEGKPKDTIGDDDFGLDAADAADAAGAPVESAPSRDARPQTPTGNDVPDDEDLYGATPRVMRTQLNERDDEDDLDALIAEAEGQDSRQKSQSAGAHDEDDLDALITEAEAVDQQTALQRPIIANIRKSDFAEEEAAMQEMDGLW
ncbi:replication fork protection component Swi3 [Metarhizium album ARSEF 1941]|uniref:Chromosome segregation in meiosis protein n=1 Tax=Metarhizium album (strain ARSEF 1941) TaxID=1081103 RepID=A0A0B2X587_METAS|nr:replication fork protection component Swi3 [Metarhizium album ARSEF 1941]KHO00466.1 replication fork protection component Swi3 [Metarhizium album ARSEF 1941]